MKPLHTMACVGVSMVLVLAFPGLSLSQGLPAGVLTADAPVFLYPDATRTPLTTLTKGTTVRILERQGDWYRIEFRDLRFGDRTGYVAVGNIQLYAAPSPAQPSAKPDEPPPLPPAGSPSLTVRRPVRGSGVRAPKEPFTISLNGGVQTTSRGFGSASTFDRFAESGTLNSTYSGDQPVVFDVAIQAGVWRGVSAGIAATQASKPLGGDVTADIPHPFFFDRPRTVTGASPDLRRQEVAVHLDAAWTVPASRSTRMTIFAGPSYFRVTQGLVTDLAAAEAYPYDTASFLSATTIEATQSKWGVNVGFDVTQRVAKFFGVGVIGRYSRARFKFPIVATQDVEVEAGGFQVGGGVRLQF